MLRIYGSEQIRTPFDHIDVEEVPQTEYILSCHGTMSEKVG